MAIWWATAGRSLLVPPARVAELADAEGLNLSGRKAVRVRIPPRAHTAPGTPPRAPASSWEMRRPGGVRLLVTATTLRHSPAATARRVLRRQPRVDRGWTPMATVFPATLTFYTGVAGASQVRGVSVTGENVYVTVDPPPSTGPFTWNASPTGGWLLNPPPPPRPPGSGTHAGSRPEQAPYGRPRHLISSRPRRHRCMPP